MGRATVQKRLATPRRAVTTERAVWPSAEAAAPAPASWAALLGRAIAVASALREEVCAVRWVCSSALSRSAEQRPCTSAQVAMMRLSKEASRSSFGCAGVHRHDFSACAPLYAAVCSRQKSAAASAGEAHDTARHAARRRRGRASSRAQPSRWAAGAEIPSRWAYHSSQKPLSSGAGCRHWSPTVSRRRLRGNQRRHGPSVQNEMFLTHNRLSLVFDDVMLLMTVL